MEQKQGFQKYKKLIVLLVALGLLGVCYILLLKFEDSIALSSYQSIDISSAKLTDLDDNRISLTIPSDYVYDATQEQLDESARLSGYESITLNEDGTATYIMTKEQHDQMISDLEAASAQSIQALVGSEDFSEVASIEVNDDFSEYKVTLSTNGFGFDSTEFIYKLLTYSNMLYSFKGEPDGTIKVTIYDINGITVTSYDSAESN